MANGQLLWEKMMIPMITRLTTKHENYDGQWLWCFENNDNQVELRPLAGSSVHQPECVSDFSAWLPFWRKVITSSAFGIFSSWRLPWRVQRVLNCDRLVLSSACGISSSWLLCKVITTYRLVTIPSVKE